MSVQNIHSVASPSKLSMYVIVHVSLEFVLCDLVDH